MTNGVHRVIRIGFRQIVHVILGDYGVFRFCMFKKKMRKNVEKDKDYKKMVK